MKLKTNTNFINKKAVPMVPASGTFSRAKSDFQSGRGSQARVTSAALTSGSLALDYSQIEPESFEDLLKREFKTRPVSFHSASVTWQRSSRPGQMSSLKPTQANAVQFLRGYWA